MKLHNRETNEVVEAEIVRVAVNDFSKIKKSKQFLFDWDEESKFEVYKIIISEEENPEIHGLISIIDTPEEMRVHINLVENSNENKGESKKYDWVAGCLLAFATKMAFENGYLGFTSLIPKTKLIGLYVNKYGFSQYGRQLAIEQDAALSLIQKYL